MEGTPSLSSRKSTPLDKTTMDVIRTSFSPVAAYAPFVSSSQKGEEGEGENEGEEKSQYSVYATV